MVKMRASSLWIIATLVLSAAECSAILVESASLLTRSQLANAPSTIAGIHLAGRRNTLTGPSPPPSRPRGLVTGTWHAPNSQTYVVITITNHIAGAAVMKLLDDAYTAVLTHINIHGDGLIVDGQFSWSGPAGLAVRTANADNHQQTWGVLGAALHAVAQFMFTGRVGAGSAIFSIFDGKNLVGTGTVG